MFEMCYVNCSPEAAEEQKNKRSALKKSPSRSNLVDVNADLGYQTFDECYNSNSDDSFMKDDENNSTKTNPQQVLDDDFSDMNKENYSPTAHDDLTQCKFAKNERKRKSIRLSWNKKVFKAKQSLRNCLKPATIPYKANIE